MTGDNGRDPEVELLQERITELEISLAADSDGWMSLTSSGDVEFSREAIRKIGHLARLNWLKNPLIRRGVDVQAFYVYGQGVTIRAADEEVNDVIQAFLDDAKNRVEFTSHKARLLKETDLRLFGNIFFIFFVNKSTGRVRVRTISVDEVEDIVCNPEDAKEPWFYLRSWWQIDMDGKQQTQKVAYPDWRYNQSTKLGSVRGYAVDWEHPVHHVKSGGLSDMRFGLSEVYPALDWAKAYKMFLEDWATLARAYSRFAHKLTLPSNRDVNAAKAKLGTTFGDSAGETNPPPVVGSTFISGPGVDMQPVRIGGANVSSSDGRRLLLMVAATMGLPETFWGDAEVGTLATASSLDRPTELQMRSRQTFWSDVHQDVLRYAIEQAVRAGKLAGKIIEEEDGTPRIELAPDPDTGEPRDITIAVDWPPILEHDIPGRVGAIVDAATLKGGTPAGTIGAETVSRLLLQALDVSDVDALLDELYPPGDEVGAEGEGAEEPMPTVTEFAAALREVKVALAGMQVKG